MHDGTPVTTHQLAKLFDGSGRAQFTTLCIPVIGGEEWRRKNGAYTLKRFPLEAEAAAKTP
jgi:hypothetical protein